LVKYVKKLSLKRELNSCLWSLEPKINTCQSITLSNEPQATTAEFVFEPYIYHILYYACISHRSMGRYSTVKKYIARHPI